MEEIGKEYKRENYHASKARDPIDQARGIKPWLSTQNPVQVKQNERPLKDKLKPHNPHKEMGLLSNEIIAVFAGVPVIEVDQQVR